MKPPSGNAAQYFVDRHRIGPIAEKLAFVEGGGGGRSLSYADLVFESDRMAGLYQRHGIRRDERAAMLVHDVIEFPVIFWGSLKCGVVPVPLNTLLTPDIYQSILNDSQAAILFVSANLLATVASVLPHCPELRQIIVLGGEGDEVPQFANELANSNPLTMIESAPDAIAFWLYSSGSTGAPKGVRHVHSSLQATAETYGAQILKIQTDDTVFSAAKLFFAYGLGNSMSFPMSVGATAVLNAGRPTPAAVFDVIQRTRPTIFCGVPTLYAAMLSEMDGTIREGCDGFRRCISAGEALPADAGERWQDLTGTEILDGVGSTELLHIFLSNAPDNVEFGTSGVAVPGYEMRLVNEDGGPVADDEIGELLVTGPSAAADYWNRPEKNDATFQGGWTRTGDKYQRRADGRLIYCGRTDDMFKVSGNWVSPFEVEQVLASHPSVLEAAIVPRRDRDGLEKPQAYIVLQPEADPIGLKPELQALVKSNAAKWSYPRWIEFVDALPKTATGKIQRFKLRAQSR